MRALRAAPSYWAEHSDHLNDQILSIRSRLGENIDSARYSDLIQALETIPAMNKQPRYRDGKVVIGSEEDIDLTSEEIKLLLKHFIPWKKGPFEILGQPIDAEWRSDWKWNRLLPHIPELSGAKIADIGCNNGYYMYRMLEHNPELVVGFDPFPKLWFTYQLLQRLSPDIRIQYELLGVEHIDLYPRFFDVIFCLGILYHHTDPVGLLRKIRSSLKSRGHLVIDCQGIPGEDSIALTPSLRYAGARGVWFLPTLSCLQNWLIRAGFKQTKVIFNEPLSVDEQRSTEWAPIESLNEALDPADSPKTVEGYPAPYRFYLLATESTKLPL